MDDPAKEYEVTALGRTWQIVYDNHAFRRIEEKLGCSIWEVLLGHSLETKSPEELLAGDAARRLFSRLGFREVTVLIWGGLLRHHSGATLSTVDDIADELGFARLVEIIVEAIPNARPFRRFIGTEQSETVSSQE